MVSLQTESTGATPVEFLFFFPPPTSDVSTNSHVHDRTVGPSGVKGHLIPLGVRLCSHRLDVAAAPANAAAPAVDTIPELFSSERSCVRTGPVGQQIHMCCTCPVLSNQTQLVSVSSLALLCRKVPVLDGQQGNQTVAGLSRIWQQEDPGRTLSHISVTSPIPLTYTPRPGLVIGRT